MEEQPRLAGRSDLAVYEARSPEALPFAGGGVGSSGFGRSPSPHALASGRSTPFPCWTKGHFFMRRTLTLSAVLALLVTAVGVTLAGASSSGDDRGGKRFHVLHVMRDTGNDVFLDLDHSATADNPAPDSVGDEDVFSADFYVDDEKVGFDGGVCKLVRLPAFYHCIATNSFAEGDLTVQFLADFTQSAPGHFAITGGTGAYRGASGEVTYVDNPDPQRDDVTFTFTTR
jgi:hypothetical protein